MVNLRSVKMYCPKLRKHKSSEFAKWWPCFQAFATHKEFAEVLNVTKYANLPDDEIEFEADGVTIKAATRTDEEKEAVLKNRLGMAAFVVAFMDCEVEDCMTYIWKSKTTAWPYGQSHQVVNKT